jgi:G3E family GTPase
MSKAIQFAMLGGFLGAGKTTTIARLARRCVERGQRVAIVTNDQAEGLADTKTLAAHGFPVAEVAGACFCCQFDTLTERIGTLAQAERPDVIFAEPVGSCTDLVATVAQALVRQQVGRITVSPYVVVVKPSMARMVLLGGATGFSEKVNYIFRKQLEEADVLFLNRADELTQQQQDNLLELLRKEFGDRPIVIGSAQQGLGLDELHRLVDQTDVASAQRLLELDYDIYAEGEAELGWLNSTARLTRDQPFDVDTTIVSLLAAVREHLALEQASIAHVKIAGSAPGVVAVANITGNEDTARLSTRSGAQASAIDLVVNARVAIEPDVLRALTFQALEAAARQLEGRLSVGETSSFSPSRPVPTYRYTTAAVGGS